MSKIQSQAQKKLPSEQSSINSAWYTGTGVTKEEAVSSITCSLIGLELLQKVLQKKISSKNKSSEEDYDSPSWAYKEADRKGYLRALTDVLNIITLKGE